MSKPNFTITSDNVLYTNSLTPLEVTPLSSNTYSNRYFLWDFGDGTISSEESPTHVYEDVGVYNVTLSQYTSSGEISSSDSQPVTAVNLIPNSIDWADDSYSSDSIIASVKNDEPFKAIVYNSWQQYDENPILNLYAENSESIPFEFSDKKIHLKPTWRFLDENDNVIENVELSPTKLYATEADGQIFISENQSEDSIFVGSKATGEFYFVDDTPSGVDVDNPFYLPTTIIVSQPLSSTYSDPKFSNEPYLKYPNLIDYVFVDNVTPDRLYISSNGAFDMGFIKFVNTQIPYNIRIVDSSGNYIKTNPFETDEVSAYEMEIGFTGDIALSSTPALTGNTLERFKTDFSNLGGFFESYFVPIDTTQSITLTAKTKVDYTLNKTPTRYGIFANENSNKIYRTTFIKDFSKTYTRKDSDVVGEEYDGTTSHKFGAAIDPFYNSIFLDSDDSRVEVYDTDFDLLSTYSLSSYDETIITNTVDLSGSDITLSNVGSSIEGTESLERLGEAMAFNGAGNIIALGAPNVNYTTIDDGHVKVFQLSGDSWTQLGQTLSGDQSGSDRFGIAVDLNNNGDRLAVAANTGSNPDYQRVYELSSGSWIQLGQTLSSGNGAEAIALNNTGDIVAVSYIFESSQAGIIQVYELSSGVWTQLGSDIVGDDTFDNLGSSLDINGDGTIVAAGSPANDGPADNLSNIGQVKVFEFSGGTWSQSGSSIYGDLEQGRFGESIALNDAGDILIVGAPEDGEVGNDAGKVKVFQLSGGSWTQLGSSLLGNAAESEFGNSVHIDNDGDTIIIGSHEDDSNGTNSGLVKLYEYVNNDWILISNPLSGENSGDFFGNQVALNSDGTRFVVNAKNFHGGGISDSGATDVYDLVTTDSITAYRGNSSPAQICLDREGNYLITLHDTADLIYIDNGSIDKRDLYPQLGSNTVLLSGDPIIYELGGLSSYVTWDGDPEGDFVFQPAAIELLSDNETLYISYTSDENNFIQKYSITRGLSSISLSSLLTQTLSSEVAVDMVSNRSGDVLYVLTTDYNTSETRIKEYNTSTNTLTSNRFVGYHGEWLTIDINQNPWTMIKDSFDSDTFKLLGYISPVLISDLEATYSFGAEAFYGIDDFRTEETLVSNIESQTLSTNEWYLWYFDDGYTASTLLSGEVRFDAWDASAIQFAMQPDLVGTDAECITNFYVNSDLITSVTETQLDPTNTLQYVTIPLTPNVDGNTIRVTSTFTANQTWTFSDDNYQRIEVTGLSSDRSSLDIVNEDIGAIKHVGGIAGDSYGNIWVLDSLNNRNLIFDVDNLSSANLITLTEDQSDLENMYVAYGDWNGFRWYNKFGYNGSIITYELSGESDPFIIYPQDKYNLQKINEDFDMTNTLKSYRTTDLMFEWDNFFDNFLGSIFGDKYDDGTKFGRNVYEKIANFVMNHSDVDTCTIESLKSIAEEVGIDFETDIVYPRDIKRIVDLFSIKYKRLWGDVNQGGIIEDYKGDAIEISSYEVSADPQVKFIATEKFNEFNTIIKPLIVSDTLSTYPLSDYSADWGWGLAVPAGGDLSDYYDFYELLPLSSSKIASIIDWDHPLTDTSIEGLSSYSNYMNENGIVSTILGDTLREGLNLYLD